MGQSIQQTSFSDEDFHAFRNKLHECLEALDTLLKRPGFGEGEASIGAELELYLLDHDGVPIPHNLEVQEAFQDPSLTLELNRYNLELNFSPVLAAGAPFSAMQQQILDNMSRLDRLMQRWEGRVLPIGILPTLRETDFGPRVMTDLPRYRVLAEAVKLGRDNSCGIHIEGQDSMHLVHDDVTLEGACTSFQVHYRPATQDLVSLWNATQLIAPLMVGVAANSPLLLGHRLWQETRVPLFCQSIDGQVPDTGPRCPPPRVSFGQGWLRHSPLELFRETVQLYPPLIPILSEEDPLAVVAAGGVPKLAELCLHDGTIWSWNRPIYDSGHDPHLRIEMRVLPAGPSAADMAANAALFIGLAQGLAEDVEPLLSALPFSCARANFYRAAQFGMEAVVYWPDARQNGLVEQPLVAVLEQLLPTAARGLAKIGVAEEEISHWLALIEERLKHRQTGASWQLRQYNRLLARGLSGKEACRQLLQGYCQRSDSNVPVARWTDL
ncbi:MAG: glutamate--cysteine ligase, partial [Gammaproteobacteria bacterium]